MGTGKPIRNRIAGTTAAITAYRDVYTCVCILRCFHNQQPHLHAQQQQQQQFPFGSDVDSLPLPEKQSRYLSMIESIAKEEYQNGFSLPFGSIHRSYKGESFPWLVRLERDGEQQEQQQQQREIVAVRVIIRLDGEIKFEDDDIPF